MDTVSSATRQAQPHHELLFFQRLRDSHNLCVTWSLTLNFCRGPLRGAHVSNGAFTEKFEGHSFSGQLVFPDANLTKTSTTQEFAYLDSEVGRLSGTV